MCKASLWSKHHEMAKQGQTYGIGISDHGLPALHPTGKKATDCIACVPNRTILTLANIPSAIQTKYGLGDTATVAFVDTGDNKHDMLDIGGKKVMLTEFANRGISALVGAMVSVSEGAGLGAPASTPARELATVDS